ncbi:MAG: nucleotide sugar dehydrogenase [Betaproteobacteria bacterium]
MNPRRVGVVGLGYVGLPTAVRFAVAGNPTTGTDTNSHLVERLRQGETNLLESWQGKSIRELLTANLQNGLLRLSDEPAEALRDCTDAVITVGVPVLDGRPQLSSFQQAITSAVKSLPPGALLLVRSTLPAGTMEGVVLPAATRAGRSVGKDLFLAYAPERMAEGRALEELVSLPTVVAAPDPVSLHRAKQLLQALGVQEFVVTDRLAMAELVKSVENAYRDVTIALANEFATLCRALRLDSHELVRLANTHPRVRLPLPGPGVGGHCLPNAYLYLNMAAEPLNVPLILTQQARLLNDRVPLLVAGLVEEGLGRAGKSLRGAKVAVLGVAMKDFCDDDRFSPAYALIAHLEEGGAAVAAFDPVVHRDFPRRVEAEEEALCDSDAAVIVAQQTGLDLDPAYLVRWMKASPVLVDTRHCLDRARAEELGCVVITI